MIRLSSQDRRSLIRLASSIPKGDETRRAILSGLKNAADEKKIPPALARILGDMKDKFTSWLDSQSDSYDLSDKGSFTEKDGAYTIKLPGGGALHEFSEEFDEEGQEVIDRAIAALIKVPVKKLQGLSTEDYLEIREGWYVRLPSKKK